MPYFLSTTQKVVLVDENLKFCRLSDSSILSYLLKGGETILAVRYELENGLRAVYPMDSLVYVEAVEPKQVLMQSWHGGK